MEGETQTNRDRAREQPYEPEYEKTERKPQQDRPNAFHALAWLLEGATGLFEEVRHNDLGLPEEFWVHAYAARRETLFALRAVLDELIRRSESQTRQEQERQQRRERRGDIKIDF
jgi:hypothetical protein